MNRQNRPNKESKETRELFQYIFKMGYHIADLYKKINKKYHSAICTKFSQPKKKVWYHNNIESKIKKRKFVHVVICRPVNGRLLHRYIMVIHLICVNCAEI